MTSSPRFRLGNAPLTSGPQQLTTMAPFFREATVNRETAEALFAGASEAQLAWRPSPTRWGLADICQHLALSTRLYLPELDAAIERGHATAAYSDAPLRGTLIGRLLVWSMEPPPRFRMPTFRELEPLPDVTPRDALAEFRASQDAFRLRLERGAGLDLTQLRIRLPEFRALAIPLGTAFAFLLAHERRHLWQASTLVQSADYPIA